MKKILSLLLTLALAVANTTAFAEKDVSKMQKSLIEVKSKIDIPSELSEFSSRLYDEENTTYTFDWTDKEKKSNISVVADDDGNIINYNFYKSEMYEDNSKLITFSKADYRKKAKEFIEKAAPKLFADETDRLVLFEDDNSIITDNQCSFFWERQKDGIRVDNDGARVNVISYKDSLYVSYAYIEWDYETEFEESVSGIENPSEAYFDKFPIEIVYAPDWDYTKAKPEKKQKLIYRFKDGKMGYILASTGEIADRFFQNQLYGERAMGLSSAKAESAEDNAYLTEEEITELENISGLHSTNEIVSTVNNMKIFGKIPTTDINETTYKTDDGYYTRINHYSDKKDVYIVADAETGKVISVNNYLYNNAYPDKEYTEKEYNNVNNKIDDFLQKYYKPELSECSEPEENRSWGYSKNCYRYINGVKALSDNIYVLYNMQQKQAEDFFMNWTKDISIFPNPEKAISFEQAKEKIEEIAPIRKIYIKTFDGFVLCYAPETDLYEVRIDAFTGKNDIKDYSTYTYEYTDISGHWAEEKIKALCEIGAGLPGSEFKPDSEITQEELLRMMFCVVDYPISEEEDIYESIKYRKIIDENNKSPESPVMREDAFVFMTSFMNLSKIASISEIFITDFNDNGEITQSKVGSAAILRGFGIISGNGTSLRPKANMTRAEAASMLYEYLLNK